MLQRECSLEPKEVKGLGSRLETTSNEVSRQRIEVSACRPYFVCWLQTARGCGSLRDRWLLANLVEIVLRKIDAVVMRDILATDASECTVFREFVHGSNCHFWRS